MAGFVLSSDRHIVTTHHIRGRCSASRLVNDVAEASQGPPINPLRDGDELKDVFAR